MELREYQSIALGELRQAMKQGSKAPLLVSPCGSGKTLISAAIVESAVQKGSRVLCLMPRREHILGDWEVALGFQEKAEDAKNTGTVS